MKITATNSKLLCKQVDEFNDTHPTTEISVNWGREGHHGTWFAHAAWGGDLKTGLTFYQVVEYVQSHVDMAVECEDLR